MTLDNLLHSIFSEPDRSRRHKTVTEALRQAAGQRVKPTKKPRRRRKTLSPPARAFVPTRGEAPYAIEFKIFGDQIACYLDGNLYGFIQLQLVTQP